MKSKDFLNRLRLSGKDRERWPRNMGDMFYRNYLDAEAHIMFKELLGTKRFTRSKRYQINKKMHRKHGNVLILGGELYKTYKTLQ
jgi:hypothetical protein